MAVCPPKTRTTVAASLSRGAEERFKSEDHGGPMDDGRAAQGWRPSGSVRPNGKSASTNSSEIIFEPDNVVFAQI